MTGSHHIAPCGTRFAFAPLSGAQEAQIAYMEGEVSARASGLLASLVTGIWRHDDPVAFDDLTLAECDAALAGLYVQLYDDAVQCEARCRACDEPFEFALSLTTFQEQAWASAANFEGDHWGELRTPSGRVIRLPRVSDLSKLHPGDQDAWIQACLVKGTFEAETLQGELAAAGPILSQDINTACPECETANLVRFDMAQYFVDTLAGEAAFLWREVHLIAKTYHWSLQEILGLTRAQRREMAGLIVAERPRVRAVS